MEGNPVTLYGDRSGTTLELTTLLLKCAIDRSRDLDARPKAMSSCSSVEQLLIWWSIRRIPQTTHGALSDHR